jgi:hypothetical protein
MDTKPEVPKPLTLHDLRVAVKLADGLSHAGDEALEFLEALVKRVNAHAAFVVAESALESPTPAALPERLEAGLLKATYAGVPVRPEDLIELRGRYNRHAELVAALEEIEFVARGGGERPLNRYRLDSILEKASRALDPTHAVKA